MPAHRPALALLVISGAAAIPAQAPRSRYEPWSLTEVARAECRGGAFRETSISADSTRMLTIGERGVAIEWNLTEACERKRFAALDGAFAVRMHPSDPWAVVLAGTRPTRAHRLDFGTGRYTELWVEPVSHVEFDAAGARVAVVFEDPNRGSRLAVYPEAALRATPPPPPDFEHDFPNDWPSRVFFHPRTGDVYVACHFGVLRVLPGGTATPTTPELCGFLADGTEVVETKDRHHPIVAGENWLAGWSKLERGGAAPASWTFADLYGSPALATDGTVVVPDEQGLLHLLGPKPERRRALRGQPGVTLQLCFDTSGRYVAIVGGCQLTVVDIQSGACARFDGSFAVHASPNRGEFTVLTGQALSAMRATDGRLTTIATLPEHATATTFERYWTGTPVLRQFLWSERALWLAQITRVTGDPGPARLHGDKLAAFPLPHAATESPYQHGLCVGAGRNGDVVLATTTRPVQCGNGLEDVLFWSTLRTYDRDGKERCTRPLAEVIAWMRTSPAGALVAVPANETKDREHGTAGKVCVYASHDLHPMHELDLGIGPIVAWEFVDEDTALASNGESLLVVKVAAGTSKKTPVALPGPITRLAVSADRELVAIACGSDVRVLRRQ